MATNYLPIAGTIESVRQTMTHVWDGTDSEIVYNDITAFKSPTTKAVASSASVLMAVGGTNASPRKGLFIKNVGEGVALINSVDTGGGKTLNPEQSISFTFEKNADGSYKDISIFARAETIATDLYIEEF